MEGQRMRALFAWLTTALCLTLFASASPQRPEVQAEYQRHFEAGIAALNANRFDDGITAFQKCLELDAENGNCAYNIACAYSLKNAVEPAFEWLGKSVDWGYANSTENIEFTETKDTDLVNLRGDARFAALVARMKETLAERTKLAEAEWRAPRIIVPKALEASETVGALVVLHDRGSNKNAIAESHWRATAEELGLVLVAPSGMHLARAKLEQGMAWFGDLAAFQARYWVAEEPLTVALAALEKSKKLDPARTILVGVGQGALVAFNAGLRAPRKYAGVLAVDGPVLPNLVQDFAANAASSGLKIKVIANRNGVFGLGKEAVQPFLGQVRNAFRALKLGGEVVEYTPEADKPEAARELAVETLKSWLAAKQPIEAGVGK